eukprot:6358796-Heterocapsa_arctica.AAC.1
MKLSAGVCEASRSDTARAVAESERTCKEKALARTSSPHRRMAMSTTSASSVACEAESPRVTAKLKTSSCDNADVHHTSTRLVETCRRKAPSPQGEASETTSNSERGASGAK